MILDFSAFFCLFLLMCMDFQKQYGSFIFTDVFVEEIVKKIQLFYSAWF
jgi:hypothetical protein